MCIRDRAGEQLVERTVELPQPALRRARIAHVELDPARRARRIRSVHQAAAVFRRAAAAQSARTRTRVFVVEIEEVVAELVHEQADVRRVVARELDVCARGPAPRTARVRARRSRHDPDVRVRARTRIADELHAPERELPARRDLKLGRNVREELAPQRALA